MNWTLEGVVVPVSELDRARTFHADQLGFTVDHDTVIRDEVRIVQLTTPGSGWSVVIGKGAVRPGRRRLGGAADFQSRMIAWSSDDVRQRLP